MLIKQTTIDRVNQDIAIESVISDFIPLKKSGSSLVGKSPFKDEKTASFHVSVQKNIYKCFATGNAGGAVKFLMDAQKLSYPDAIKYCADKLGIEVEYQDASPKQIEAHKKKMDKKEELYKVVASASNTFKKQLALLDQDHLAIKEIDSREITPDDVIQWQIGYAPKGKVLLDLCKEHGVFKPALELNLVKDNWDVYQDRVMYPIQDTNGKVVGFGGRVLGDSTYAKWINSTVSAIYDKSAVLYGLNFAISSINKVKYAILVEGYNDVVSLHSRGVENAVGCCGTSFTDNQIKLLKRYTSTVCLMLDGDDAGLKAMLKLVPILIREDLTIEIYPLKNGEDPDDFARGVARGEDLAQMIADEKEDAIIYLATRLHNEAGKSPRKQQEAIDLLIEWLALIPTEMLRSNYAKIFSSTFKVPRKTFDKALNEQVKIEAEIKKKNSQDDYQDNAWFFPDDVEREDAIKYGFYGTTDKQNTGYWFQKSNTYWEQVSNFIMVPLFHKYDIDDNTRIIKIQNGQGHSEIVEMPSKALISAEQFKQFLFDKGPFLFYGSKVHLDKLNNKFLYEFPKAFELKTLGWQNEGFFAFYNASYNGKLEEYNNIGIVKHGDMNFFSPASSDIYKDFRKDEDMYENDRYLEYVESKINYSQWAQLMEDVYEDHAKVGVPYVLLSIFRDLVFKVDNNSPFLYAYGKSKSGKSKFAESISNVFFKEMSAFNLNSGTDFAFFKRLGRFKNCPVFFNEFDDNVVKDEWFQSLKGAYDGEGRERGKGGSKNKTEIMKINCSLILVGQFLSTKDDNSVLSRSILRTFKIKEDRSDKQTEKYNLLKSLEKDGLSSMLTELLTRRADVEKDYYDRFNKDYKGFIETIRKSGKKYEERVVRNYCALYTLYKMFNNWVKLPWSVEDLKSFYVDEITNLSAMIKGSDILVDFWTTIETMFTERLLASGQHFKVETKAKVRLAKDGENYERSFAQPKELLYLRVKNVQQLYARFKSSIKDGGHAIDYTSLVSYLHDKDYFIGYVNTERFSKTDDDGASTFSTSAYVFDYKALEISLGKSKEMADLPF